MAGFRAGTSIEVSVKRFVTDHSAMELMVFNRWKGWNTELLYEHHMEIWDFRVDGMVSWGWSSPLEMDQGESRTAMGVQKHTGLCG